MCSLTKGSLVARPDAGLGEPREKLFGRESREDFSVFGEGDARRGHPAPRVVGHHVGRVVLVHGQAGVCVTHVEAEARHGDGVEWRFSNYSELFSGCEDFLIFLKV